MAILASLNDITVVALAGVIVVGIVAIVAIVHHVRAKMKAGPTGASMDTDPRRDASDP